MKKKLNEKLLYVIKDNHGNQLSRPSEDDQELWDRVEAMEKGGRKGLCVVVYQGDKVEESLPMRSTVDLDKVQQELWEMCRDNDVELYFSEARRVAGGQLGCSFEAVVDNYETVGNLRTVSDYNVSVKIVDEEALVSDDISIIADYIINTVHGKAIANQSRIREDYNGSFDTTSFIDAVNNFGVSRKRWLDFIENEAKKFIRKKEAVWEKEGWSAKDALVYGLERCDDVSYDGFDINRDEYDEVLAKLKFYVEHKPKNESINENWCDEKLDELREKGRDNWTQDDWETYAYCKNANAERDYEDMYNPDIYDYDPMMLEDPAEPSVYEDDYEVWEVEEPELTDDYEIEKEPSIDWKLVDRKTVYDSDGFTTDYSWYVDKNGHHVFVFGDSDLYRPEDGEYDWEEDNEEVAKEWFDNYKGFEEEEENSEKYWS